LAGNHTVALAVTATVAAMVVVAKPAVLGLYLAQEACPALTVWYPVVFICLARQVRSSLS
jgi:hypothetical protein